MEYEPECCPVCGIEKEWITCWSCGGEGGFDEYEFDAINYAPGEEFKPCDICNGEGGYLECPALPHVKRLESVVMEGDR